MSHEPRDNAPRRVAHIGIAVDDLDQSLLFYRRALGLEVSEVIDVPERGMRIAMLPCGDLVLELMESTGPDSQIGRFLERRGPGIHHLCLQVDDIDAKLADLAEQGVELVSSTSEVGAEGRPVAFVHPRATGGVLLELLEE